MTRAHRSPPLWFVLLVAVALALGLRVLDRALGGALFGDPRAPRVQPAFWFFITLIASAIWKGLEVAGRVTLVALGWSVKALWWFATTTSNGLKFVGNAFVIGLKASWEFLRLTYDNVIKPGLTKLWGWFDKFRHWLDDTFGPVLDWLKIVRDNVVLFWQTWVRPWLDLIDVTRRMLRIFAALGLDWARTLDTKLGQLQELIDRPFRIVLGKLNELINLVNRIVTLDGLIQRVALLRSLERDYKFAWRVLANSFHNPLTNGDYDDMRRRAGARSIEVVRQDVSDALQNDGGIHRALRAEVAATIRRSLGQ